MATLYIIRGLPGSGKSTLANKIVESSRCFEADLYFVKNDKYSFDRSKIKDAHEWCKNSVKSAMNTKEDIAVSNTFTRMWEYKEYIDMANDNCFDVQVIECHGKWDSIHSVPSSAIEAMRKRWESHRS